MIDFAHPLTKGGEMIDFLAKNSRRLRTAVDIDSVIGLVLRRWQMLNWIQDTLFR